jgi:putative NADH-flavin reductase
VSGEGSKTQRLPEPLKLVVVGASQGTGKAVVQEALDRGYYVTAVSRNPSALGLEHVKLTRVAADVTDPKTLNGIFEGAHAVIVALGGTLKGLKADPTSMSRGTKNVMEAMKAANVRRLIVLSANGTFESRSHLPWVLQKLVLDWILKLPYAEHERQENDVRDSGLDWTIVRPNRLGDGPAKHQYKVSLVGEKVPTASSRADIAHFMVNAAESKELAGKIATIGG